VQQWNAFIAEKNKNQHSICNNILKQGGLESVIIFGFARRPDPKPEPDFTT
jgi:hypothetical protein